MTRQDELLTEIGGKVSDFEKNLSQSHWDLQSTVEKARRSCAGSCG